MKSNNKPIGNLKGSKSALGSLLSASGNNANAKLTTIVPPVLHEVGKLAAGVASVSTKNPVLGSATGNPRNKCALQPGHSLMDWIRLGASGKDLTGIGAQAGRLSVTEKELSEHDKRTDAWLAIRGRVYNVTAYLPFHPGGPEELMRGVGTDATNLFEQIHAWVNYEQILQKCYIGRLASPTIEDNPFIIPKAVQPVQSPSTSTNNNQEEFHPQIDSNSLPRFDWIQKLDSITLIFYTKAFSNPLVELFQSDDSGLLVLIQYDGAVYSNELVFFDQVTWPCQTKITYETGKIELVFKKSTSGAIWDNYGVLRQKCKASGTISTNIKYSYRLVDAKSTNYNTFLLKLERTDGSKLVCPVGRHVRAFAADGTTTRSYTPVPDCLFSDRFAPNQSTCDNICLLIKKYPTGNLSKYLCERRIGQIVELSKPIGTFDLKVLERREIVLLLAAGTGITPMLSLIIFLLERRIKKTQVVRLIFFNRCERDILLKNQLEQLVVEDRRLRVDFVLSDADPSWIGLVGTVRKELIANAIAEHLQDTGYTIRNLFACICGPNGFTASCQGLLTEVGLEDEQVHLFQG